MFLLIYCNKEHIRRLQILFNKAVRILLGCSGSTRVTVRLKECNFIAIEQMIWETNLILVYKIKHGFCSEFQINRCDILDYNLGTTYSQI